MFDGPHDHGQWLIITQVVELRLFSASVLNAQLLNLFVCLGCPKANTQAPWVAFRFWASNLKLSWSTLNRPTGDTVWIILRFWTLKSGIHWGPLSRPTSRIFWMAFRFWTPSLRLSWGAHVGRDLEYQAWNYLKASAVDGAPADNRRQWMKIEYQSISDDNQWRQLTCKSGVRTQPENVKPRTRE